MDPALSQKLMSGRYGGDEAKKDIHEKDQEYLARSRRAADYCAKKLGWRTLESAPEGVMLPPEEIAQKVRQLLADL